MSKKTLINRKTAPYVFLAPTILIFLAFMIYPILRSFYKFAMTDTKLQASGFENFGLYPSYIPSYEEEVFSKGDPFFGSTNVYTVFIENGKKVADIATSPNSLEANDSISAAVSKIFLNKEDVEKTMKDLQAELESKFAKK